MKYAKILGLLAFAAAALMAFAGTASATLTSPAGTPYEGESHSSSQGSISMTGSITITCQKSTSAVGGGTNDANEASGPVEVLTYEECGSHTVTVIQKGTQRITDNGSGSGSVFATGSEVTVLLHSPLLGTVHCIYQTNETFLGTFKGGTTAKISITAAAVPRVATDSACGEHSTMEGTYSISTPDTLLID